MDEPQRRLPLRPSAHLASSEQSERERTRTKTFAAPEVPLPRLQGHQQTRAAEGTSKLSAPVDDACTESGATRHRLTAASVARVRCEIDRPVVHQQPPPRGRSTADYAASSLVGRRHAPAVASRPPADGPSARPPSRGSSTGSRVQRPRSRAVGASSAASTPRSTARPHRKHHAVAERVRCSRPRPLENLDRYGRRAEPGAPASPSSAPSRWSTPARPRPSRPTLPAAPRPDRAAEQHADEGGREGLDRGAGIAAWFARLGADSRYGIHSHVIYRNGPQLHNACTACPGFAIVTIPLLFSLL